jgi:hypothetical protein
VTLLPVTGDFTRTTGQPNLNGIVDRCSALLATQTSTPKLFRGGTDRGAPTKSTSAARCCRPDGLELGGTSSTRSGDGLVTVVGRKDGLARRVVRGATTDPGGPDDPLLDVPTTATVATGGLWVFNARFATTPTSDTEHWITQLPLWPGKELSSTDRAFEMPTA